MWVAKILVDGSDGFFGKIAKRLNIRMNIYPMNHKDHTNFSQAYLWGNVSGDDASLEKFQEILKSDPSIEEFEYDNGFFILVRNSKQMHSIFYHPHILYLKPVLVDEKGMNTYEFGSLNREYLTKFLDVVEKEYPTELVNIKEDPPRKISMICRNPPLTKKQQDSFSLATSEGYYNFPRKISLVKLAKKSQLSFSTFRTHLRKAESKIMSHMLNNF